MQDGSRGLHSAAGTCPGQRVKQGEKKHMTWIEDIRPGAKAALPHDHCCPGHSTAAQGTAPLPGAQHTQGHRGSSDLQDPGTILRAQCPHPHLLTWKEWKEQEWSPLPSACQCPPA